MANTKSLTLALLFFVPLLSGCISDGADGIQGPEGAQGPPGEDGADGIQGPEGAQVRRKWVNAHLVVTSSDLPTCGQNYRVKSTCFGRRFVPSLFHNGMGDNRLTAPESTVRTALMVRMGSTVRTALMVRMGSTVRTALMGWME